MTTYLKVWTSADSQAQWARIRENMCKPTNSSILVSFRIWKLEPEIYIMISLPNSRLPIAYFVIGFYILTMICAHFVMQFGTNFITSAEIQCLILISHKKFRHWILLLVLKSNANRHWLLLLVLKSNANWHWLLLLVLKSNANWHWLLLLVLKPMPIFFLLWNQFVWL